MKRQLWFLSQARSTQPPRPRRIGGQFFGPALRPKWIRGAVLALGLMLPRQLFANPEGMQVVNGAARVQQNGLQLTVQVADRTTLDWSSFNIGPRETTTFIQPDAFSVVLNRIHDASPSQIFGRLQANGQVILANSSGFYFGPDSVIQAAGLILTTAPVAPLEGGGGALWQFNGAPPLASIINYGHIEASPGGSLYLIAQKIEQYGVLMAPDGNIGLYAGKEVLVSQRPDGRGLSAKVQLPEGSVDNAGRISADAGLIELRAQVVNQGGELEANSVRERHGVIELVASEALNLTADSVISARGDQSALSPGGRIRLHSEGKWRDSQGSQVDVRGGGQGGEGGRLEVCSRQFATFRSLLEGGTAAGWKGGRLSIDPKDIELGSSVAGHVPADGRVDPGDEPVDGTLRLDVHAHFRGFSEIILQATRDISLLKSTIWNLNESTGLSSPDSQLVLRAGRNINIENGARLVAKENWSMTLEAGADESGDSGVLTGEGGIYLKQSGALEAANGNIRLLAGHEIKLEQGFVHTLAGGSISAEAVAGDIDTGRNVSGYSFTSFKAPGYAVDSPNLGGISTAGGGDVSLKAGRDVTSYLPTQKTSSHFDGGTGAFGEPPGNVTVEAGRSVYGHYVVRNGQGQIKAGWDAGSSSKQIALSLVKGDWTVSAGHDICLQEARNPNGVFNSKLISNPYLHKFDYDPQAAVILHGAHSVQLLADSLPRNPRDSNEPPPLYPPILQISAGPGGVILGADLTLFPSPYGDLKIETTGGGSLQSKDLTIRNLIVSDSQEIQYILPFSGVPPFSIADHGPHLLHKDAPEPLQFDISGEIKNLVISVPRPALLKVAGNVHNASLLGQNLRADDRTSIEVQGNILNRSFTFVTVDSTPDFFVINNAYAPSGPAEFAPAMRIQPGKFRYIPRTRQIAYAGRMSADERDALKSIYIPIIDAQGVPVRDPLGRPIYQPADFLPHHVLDQLFALSQDAVNEQIKGFQLAGPGTFEIRAGNIDLARCEGITSLGPQFNPALASLDLPGADLVIHTPGHLEMYSSSIASRFGGDISVTVGQRLTVGSIDMKVADSSSLPRGIYSSSDGDIFVEARGDIEVNGSRIASYDGGDIVVRSLEGNIDAGQGGTGYIRVTKVVVHPETHRVASISASIPGSGILAASLLDDPARATPPKVGDILVEAPRGNVNASAGGITQIAGGERDAAARLIVRAGSKDDQGNVLHRGSINAEGSGIIGRQVHLEATEKVTGVVLAHDIDITAREGVNVTAVAQGSVNISSSGGAISGTIVGVGSVSAAGASIDAALLSNSVNTSGEVTSKDVGFAPTAVAGATSQAAAQTASSAAASAVSTAAESSEDEELDKKYAKKPVLARTVSRVTVILQ